MDKNNPVAKQFEKLDEQWQEFLDSDKPVFHWKIPADSYQLLNSWVKLKESFDEKNPDLFAHIALPFSDTEKFAWDVAFEFNGMIKDGLDDSIPEGGEDCTWHAPNPQNMQNGFDMLLASAMVVLDEFGDCLESLTMVIAPTPIKESEAYTRWWQRIGEINTVYKDWPEKLKLLVFDHARQPFLQPVADTYSDFFYSVVASVDYTGALNKVLDEADDGSDAAKVRKNLFEMQNAIAESNGEKLKNSRKIALPLAKGNGWFDIATTINLTCAAGLMSWKHYDSALKEYANAQSNATRGRQENIPGCEKLLLLGLLNESTCLYLKGDLLPAAERYETTAQLANEIQDDWTELEAWRMGSFCCEQAGQKQRAWSLATRALELGRGLESEKREQTTLPFVGQAMLRMSPNSNVEREVDDAMIELLGKDWQENIKEALS